MHHLFNLTAPDSGSNEMGGRKEVAEKVGYSSRQADREDQRIGGCAEASYIAQGLAEQVAIC